MSINRANFIIKHASKLCMTRRGDMLALLWHKTAVLALCSLFWIKLVHNPSTAVLG